MKNCNVCGRVILSGDDSLCGLCLENKRYKIVREYVYKNKGATVVEVSEATGVAPSIIIRYLKEKRLSLLNDRTLLPQCRVCGTVIDYGEKCKDCKNKETQPAKTFVAAKSDSRFGRRRR